MSPVCYLIFQHSGIDEIEFLVLLEIPDIFEVIYPEGEIGRDTESVNGWE